MTTSAPVEKFLPPKEIAEALGRNHGLDVSADYIRAVRRRALLKGDRLFVAGMARPGEVFAWLQANPDFRVRQRNTPGCASL